MHFAKQVTAKDPPDVARLARFPAPGLRHCDCACHHNGNIAHAKPCCYRCPDCGKLLIYGLDLEHREKYCLRVQSRLNFEAT